VRRLRRLGRRVDPAVVRGAWWTFLAVRRVRRQLRRGPLDSVWIPAPPRLPARAGRGVDAVLRRLDPSCLERSLVLQRWLKSTGVARAVIIGVTAPGAFRAHAWLEGENGAGFTEIQRVAP